MPITFDLDRVARSIRTRCVGNVTFDEVMDHFRELGDLKPLPEGLDVLLDLTEMASLPAGTQMRGVASGVTRIDSIAEWGCWAVVTDRDALYGMVRMLRVFLEGQVRDFGVFRDLAEAERWLAAQRSADG